MELGHTHCSRLTFALADSGLCLGAGKTRSQTNVCAEPGEEVPYPGDRPGHCVRRFFEAQQFMFRYKYCVTDKRNM